MSLKASHYKAITELVISIYEILWKNIFLTKNFVLSLRSIKLNYIQNRYIHGTS